MNLDCRTALLTYWKVMARKKKRNSSTATAPSPWRRSTPSLLSRRRQRGSEKSAVVVAASLMRVVSLAKKRNLPRDAPGGQRVTTPDRWRTNHRRTLDLYIVLGSMSRHTP